MLKNLHFCTKELVRRINYNGNRRYLIIKTFRTGYVPSYRTGEIIRLNYRNKDKKDTFLKCAKVIAIFPIQFRDIPWSGKKEIFESYNGRKFHPEYWFFEIVLRKWADNHGKVFESTTYWESKEIEV